jgi:hypothetical protein
MSTMNLIALRYWTATRTSDNLSGGDYSEPLSNALSRLARPDLLRKLFD